MRTQSKLPIAATSGDRAAGYYLTPGQTIAIVAPSGPFDRAWFDRGLARLRERYVVSFDESLFSRTGYLAGSDARRSDELLDALANPDVAAIVAARGGYGAARLLPLLPVDPVQRANAVLIGFSDVTALHALWDRAGVPSVHASMVTGLGHQDDDQAEQWLHAVEGTAAVRWTNLKVMQAGKATGLLKGGNLSVLASLLGTPYMPNLDGAIVLLEDVGERPYRLDRMLTTMRQSGNFDNVRGFVLGQFVRCRTGADRFTAEQVLMERLSDLGVPMVANAPVGHGHQNDAVWLGLDFEIDGNRAGTVT